MCAVVKCHKPKVPNVCSTQDDLSKSVLSLQSEKLELEKQVIRVCYYMAGSTSRQETSSRSIIANNELGQYHAWSVLQISDVLELVCYLYQLHSIHSSKPFPVATLF